MRKRITGCPAHGHFQSTLRNVVSLVLLNFGCLGLSNALASDEPIRPMLKIPASYDIEQLLNSVQREAAKRQSKSIELYVYTFYPNEADSVNACAWLQAQGFKAHTAVATAEGVAKRDYTCTLTESGKGVSRDWFATLKSTLDELNRGFGGSQKDWMFFFNLAKRADDTSG